MPKNKVLIIEDEKAIRVALADSLREEGIEVLEAGDGKTGLNLALNEHPDIVILDVIMPRMHGLEVYKNIRKDNWGQGVKVVFLTNFGSDLKVQKATTDKNTELVIKNQSNINDFIKLVKDRLYKITL